MTMSKQQCGHLARRADLAQRDAADDEEPLPLADDGVHHEVEDSGGDGPALGDAVPGSLRDKSGFCDKHCTLHMTCK